MSDGLRVVKKTQVFKDLALDYAERSLIVSYTVESILQDSAGKPAGTDLSNSKKRIRLKAIDADTDVPALADAIMKSCEIIPQNKQPLLVELLYELQLADTRSARRDAGAQPQAQPKPSKHARSESSGTSQRTNSAGVRSERGSDGKEPEASPSSGVSSGGAGSLVHHASSGLGDDVEEVPASVDQVEDYLEQLYEESAELKAAGAKKILSLALHPSNLLSLIENGTLMGALGRVLKDDYRKSTRLTLIIMQTFFAIAHFKDLHPVLITNRIGDMCMRIVELEQRRYVARVTDLERFATLGRLQSKNDAGGEAAFRKVDAEARQREEEEDALAAAREAAAASDGKQSEDAAAGSAAGDEAGGGRRRKAKAAKADGESGEDKRPIKLRPLPEGRVDIEKERRKFFAAVRKSEGLTYVCLHLLMNLAEDLDIERKMCKRGIVGLLTPLLERNNPVLLLLAVNFLRKLSIFEENKDAMVAQGAGTKLVVLLPEPAVVPTLPPQSTPGDVRVDLFASILHLMFNLTFDASMCQAFITAGALVKVGAMLRAAPFRATGLKLLYRLSTDLAVRGQMAGSDAVNYTLSMAVKFPQPRLPSELAALAVNLSMHPLTVIGMCKPDALKALVSRIIKTGDPAVAKIVRGISQYTYGAQADSELKAHAMEDLRRELARNAAMMGDAEQQAKKRKQKKKDAAKAAAAAKAGNNGRSSSRSRRGRDGGDGKQDDDGKQPDAGDNGDSASTASGLNTNSHGSIDGNDGSATGSINLANGVTGANIPSTYLPEPDEPIKYDYPFEGLWAPVLRDLLRAVKSADAAGPGSHDLLIELLGTLSNLTPRDFPENMPMAVLTEDQEFMSIITRSLNPAAVNGEDDILLEAVQVVSALALDPVSAPVLAASPIPRLLGDVLSEKGGDVDTAMQTVNCIARLLHQHETRDVLVSASKVPARLVELLGHPLDRLAAEVDDCIYIMIEHDREFGTGGLWQQLQSRRFAIHNHEWVRAAEQSMGSQMAGMGSNRPSGAAGQIAFSGGGDDALLLKRQQQQQMQQQHQQQPDAYVADDHDQPNDDDEQTGYGEDEEAAEGGGSQQPTSPLHHMGRRGEQVAFDVSYLYQQARSAPALRPLVSNRPGIGAPYDYEEPAEDIEDIAEEDEENEDEDDDISEDVRAMMDQYMHAGNTGGRAGAGGGSSMYASTGIAMAGLGGGKGLVVPGGVNVRGPVPVGAHAPAQLQSAAAGGRGGSGFGGWDE